MFLQSTNIFLQLLKLLHKKLIFHIFFFYFIFIHSHYFLFAGFFKTSSLPSLFFTFALLPKNSRCLRLHFLLLVSPSTITKFPSMTSTTTQSMPASLPAIFIATSPTLTILHHQLPCFLNHYLSH